MRMHLTILCICAMMFSTCNTIDIIQKGLGVFTPINSFHHCSKKSWWNKMADKGKASCFNLKQSCSKVVAGVSRYNCRGREKDL